MGVNPRASSEVSESVVSKNTSTSENQPADNSFSQNSCFKNISPKMPIPSSSFVAKIQCSVASKSISTMTVTSSITPTFHASAPIQTHLSLSPKTPSDVHHEE